MNTVQTKKDEVIKVISKYEEIPHSVGMYANKGITKNWVEDFVDEDTAEVVSIERKEILFDKGTELTPDVISQLLFYFQSGDIKEIEISNQKRAAYENSFGTRVYLAIAEIGIKRKKYKFLFSAANIPTSIEILKDYMELNFSGGYRIVSIKEFKTSIIIEDTLKKENEILNDEDTLNNEKFYQITVISKNEDDYEYESDAVVKTIDLDKAIILFNRKLMEGRDDKDKFTSRLEEAKLLNVNYLIEDDFTLAYQPEKLQ